MPSPNRNIESLEDALRGLLSGAGPINLPSRVTGFNRESVGQLDVVEPMILHSTLYYFLDFTFEGLLPHSGTKTTLPLIREDEIPLKVQPYSEWAPGSYSQQPSVFQERLLTRPDDCNVCLPRGMSLLRARLWMGMVPMSGGRWKEKKLDDWRNWQHLFDFVYHILVVFLWMGDPDSRQALEKHFNFVASELEVLQNALNARRDQRRIVRERVDLKALWLEFIRSSFEAMVTRTHNWIKDRVEETIASARAAYAAEVREKGAANSYAASKKCGEVFSDLSRLLNQADFALMMPLNGFAGFIPSPSDSKVVGSLLQLPFRRDRQDELADATSWPASEEALEDMEVTRRAPSLLNAAIDEALTKRQEIRHQMRGEPASLGREHWISVLQSRTRWSLEHGGPQDQKWGFVAYMLTHTPTNEQWTAFLSKIYADFDRSGQWVQGFNEVRSNRDIQWIDGKSSGIPHDDIEAAKRHFRIFRNSPKMRRRAWGNDFIVIDTASFNSYMTPFPDVLPATPPSLKSAAPPSHGDFGGFVKLIDLLVYPARLIAEQSPGYRNELRVLGSLLFDELYPLLVSMTLRPKDLWVAALWHPLQVYVGNVTESQEKSWNTVWELREIALGAFSRLVEQQRGGR